MTTATELTIIDALEDSLASKLSVLKAKVRLFADEFSNAGNATQQSMILVGHSTSQFLWANDVQDPVGWEQVDFELRCQTSDLKNHKRAMNYLSQAMSLIRGYCPYDGIRPFQPQRYAPSGFDPASGLWLYGGLVRTWVERPRDEYPSFEDQVKIEGITIGLWRDGLVLQRQIQVQVDQ